MTYTAFITLVVILIIILYAIYFIKKHQTVTMCENLAPVPPPQNQGANTQTLTNEGLQELVNIFKETPARFGDISTTKLYTSLIKSDQPTNKMITFSDPLTAPSMNVNGDICINDNNTDKFCVSYAKIKQFVSFWDTQDNDKIKQFVSYWDKRDKMYYNVIMYDILQYLQYATNELNTSTKTANALLIEKTNDLAYGYTQSVIETANSTLTTAITTYNTAVTAATNFATVQKQQALATALNNRNISINDTSAMCIYDDNLIFPKTQSLIKGLVINAPANMSVLWVKVKDATELQPSTYINLYTYDTTTPVLKGTYVGGTKYLQSTDNSVTWVPIPLSKNIPKYVISAYGVQNDNTYDTKSIGTICGIGFSSNPWNHATNSAHAYITQINNLSNVKNNATGYLAIKNTIFLKFTASTPATFNVPVIKSLSDKLLYIVKSKSTRNTYNAKIGNTSYAFITIFINPYSMLHNTNDTQYIATIINKSDIPDNLNFLTVELSGNLTALQILEMGTHDYV